MTIESVRSLEELCSDPRITIRRDGPPDPDGRVVVYWMQRAQRGLDNPALDVAIHAGNALKQPVIVFFGLHPGYPRGNLRHYQFLVEGLAETRERVEKRGCLFVFRPWPEHNLFRLCDEVRASLVVGDENPLREPERWRQKAAGELRVPFWTVDADVIVPSKLIQKEEFAARTIRPKIERLLPVFLHECSNPRARIPYRADVIPSSQVIEQASILEQLPLDRGTSPVRHFRGGTSEGLKRLRKFVKHRLEQYGEERNLPDRPGTSELSPYLHFGQLGPHTIALAVNEASAPREARESYLEQLIVRRELGINFVSRNPNYDTLAGSPPWALKTLSAHAMDPRPYHYNEKQLEAAETHDELWNAAQREMVLTGWMHGYMRMFWGKKILEWTESPEEAFEIAVRLNDRYELDGRDPNGYAGIAWSIGGKHDRPWPPSRPVFGILRYMSAKSCARKFDIKAYIERIKMLG